jgi:hypothetical protein
MRPLLLSHALHIACLDRYSTARRVLIPVPFHGTAPLRTSSAVKLTFTCSVTGVRTICNARETKVSSGALL